MHVDVDISKFFLLYCSHLDSNIEKEERVKGIDLVQAGPNGEVKLHCRDIDLVAFRSSILNKNNI